MPDLPAPPSLASPTPQRASRRDGEASRERLLLAALNLFAEKGYAPTSTRDIAEAAGTNVAAIAYYFGDKAGLYRAVAEGPMQPVCRLLPAEAAEPRLDAMLRHLYSGYVEPLKHGQPVRQCLKLHMREMLEPTGLWSSSLIESVKPVHEALAQALSRHLGLDRPDDDVRRLAICIAALGVHQHVACDVIDAIAPQLSADAGAFDTWIDRMVLFACAMVEAERKRRGRTAARAGNGSTRSAPSAPAAKTGRSARPPAAAASERRSAKSRSR
ncbi:MAG TPA: CerR family C-terminal domain-containing protein [Caldimonas sp.]|jgi:AcrR family transcriptional regulator|nr:CerR family C-terminal domain-containing protein [Caldimonas sp.]HEX2540735.1 CerR family C-terminal domain-containing protein [Caldimonas sp.]